MLDLSYRRGMRCELRRDYRFEAARRLPNIDPGHPCARTHGHSFRLRVKVAGEVAEPAGWVIDFGEIDAIVDPVVAELDHALLNDIDGLDNPTSEYVARWVWERISERLPGLVSVRISETEASSVTYRGA
jgi:6-pyruvoyltetrahydropterin/6-carboxytetrahydropterin synthase